jgi:hypothetical protein
MGKSDEGDCPESEKANGCKIRPSAPEAMPKVGGARGPNMNYYNLHMSHPSVPEAMLKIDGASSTVGKPEPRMRIRMAMGSEQPRIPQMVSEMDGSLELQLYLSAPSQLDGKTKIKLGLIDNKGQIAAATKYDDAKVPEYVWDMRALRLG